MDTAESKLLIVRENNKFMGLISIGDIKETQFEMVKKLELSYEQHEYLT